MGILTNLTSVIYFLIASLPLEGDLIIIKGMGKVENGEYTVKFYLPEPKNNLFLNIEGLPSFKVFLNNVFLAEFEEQNKVSLNFSRTKSHLDRINELKIQSSLDGQEFSYCLWQSNYNWYFGTFHIHTRYSDGTHTVSELLHFVNEEGGNFCAISDHDTLGQCYDTAFHRTGNCEPIRATEWTTDSGHANILGPEGANSFSHGPIFRMIDDATYRGGLVQINHPCDDEIGMGWDRYPILDQGIDVIEVFNSFTWFPERDINSDPEAVAWWHQLLCAGKRIAAAGNSDYHGSIPGEHPLISHSAVYARSDHPDTILKALKLGRVMVCDEMDDSRLYIYADTNNNNIMDLIMGDNFSITTGSKTIKFRLEVDDADALDEVLVFSRQGLIYSRTLTFGGDYVYEWQRTFTSNDTNFMRVELRSVINDYEYCTNPIYINYPDYELGPCDLITEPVVIPETTYVGVDTIIYFSLSNWGFVSPYRFSMFTAVDTLYFDITAWQQTGPGIGEVIHTPNLLGFEIIEWKGGYPYSVRLSPNNAFTYWVKVKAKREGFGKIYYRSCADDRLFIIEKEPSSGYIGPDREYWKTDSIYAITPGAIKEKTTIPYPSSLFLFCQPNPANDKLKIIIPSNLMKDCDFTLKVYDAKGGLVKKFSPDNNVLIWDLAGMQNGIYFVILKKGMARIIEKIAIIR